MRRRPLAAVCLILICLLYLGTLLVTRSPSDFSEWEGEWVTVTGKVVQKEEVSQKQAQQTILYLQLFSVQKEAKKVQIKKEQSVICYVKSNQTVPELGSIVRAEGKLKCFSEASNPGQFDAASYYRILKISFQLNQTEIQQKSNTYSQIKEALYQCRKTCAEIFDRMLSPKEASLMKIMLLGEKRAADQEIKTLYQQNGIAHILAISALHISLLGMTLYRMLKKSGIPPFIRTGLSMLVILLYVCMTGFSVSAIRALLMFGLHMAAVLFKRTYDLLTAVSVAAVLLLIQQPLYLYHSGFLFSFGCVYAIGLVVPAMTTAGKEKKRKHMLKRKEQTIEEIRPEKQPKGMLLRLLSGFSLTLACLPLQLWYFYQIPLYSTFLNLLVIPLMSLLVPGGILLLMTGGIEGAVFELSAKGAAALITGILSIYEDSCLVFSKFPGHLLNAGRPERWQVFGYLLVLAGLVILQNRLSLKTKWSILTCSAILLTVSFPEHMAITFLDVGQGDCIHIRSETGTHYLVDGGSSSVSGVGEYRILPYLKYQGAGEVEAVFVTHPDADHCNGILELLELGKAQGISVKKVYLPEIGEAAKTESYREILQAAELAGAGVEYLSAGQQLKEGGLSFFCLHPVKGDESRDANEYSLVLAVSYGEFQALLTGDVEGEGEQQVIEALEERKEAGKQTGITVLKASHHGSGSSTPDALLSLLSPAYTVISCGKNNSYGHPHPALLERLNRQKTKICITYETGALTFETDGKRLWVTQYLGSFLQETD